MRFFPDPQNTPGYHINPYLGLKKGLGDPFFGVFFSRKRGLRFTRGYFRSFLAPFFIVNGGYPPQTAKKTPPQGIFWTFWGDMEQLRPYIRIFSAKNQGKNCQFLDPPKRVPPPGTLHFRIFS